MNKMKLITIFSLILTSSVFTLNINRSATISERKSKVYEKCEVVLDSTTNKLKYKHDNSLVDLSYLNGLTSKNLKEPRFVYNFDKEFLCIVTSDLITSYQGKRLREEFNHLYIAKQTTDDGKAPAKFICGEVYLNDGVISFINNKSGHCNPMMAEDKKTQLWDSFKTVIKSKYVPAGQNVCDVTGTKSILGEPENDFDEEREIGLFWAESSANACAKKKKYK
jgi:hypothetical protein